MLFALVLGLLIGAATVVLIRQWREDALGTRTASTPTTRPRPPLDGFSQPGRHAA